MSKNHSTSVNPGKTATQSQRIFATLVLTSMLSFAASVTLLQAAYAAPRQISQSAASEIVNGKPSDNSLPPRIANAVRQDLSRKVGIAPGKLRIIESSSQTWSDSCLGLGGSAELCAQALVPGWRVVLSNGNQTWVYRTDTQGRAVRLENQTASRNLPKSVADAVLQTASQELGVSSDLRIVQAEQKTWANPCIFNFGEVCTREYKPITGWQVTVASRQQRLVYRTDKSGSQVKLDKQASQISGAKLPDVTKPDSSSRGTLNEGASRIGDANTLKATKIRQSELPPPLSEGVVFRAIASGGFTGQTFQTTLMNDGRVMRVAISPNNAQGTPTVIRQISPQEKQQFQQLLRQNFSRFDQLSYRAPNGSADFISITLTSADGTTKYADMVQGSLPKALQEVIQAWNQIAS